LSLEVCGCFLAGSQAGPACISGQRDKWIGDGEGGCIVHHGSSWIQNKTKCMHGPAPAKNGCRRAVCDSFFSPTTPAAISFVSYITSRILSYPLLLAAALFLTATRNQSS
jgi:hypothetical protein